MSRLPLPLTRVRLLTTALIGRRRGDGRGLTIALVVLNLCAVAGYLWVASHLWLPPQEVAAGITPQSADYLLRGWITLPFWVCFVALDTCWAIYVLVPPPRWRKAGLAAVCLALWLIALRVDSSHY